MKSDSETGFEVIGALADGQLRGNEFVRTVNHIHDDSHARSTWHAYHVIGDVLRGTELSKSVLDDAGFVSRFQARLAGESGAGMVASPSATPEFSVSPISSLEAGKRLNQSSANDAGFKWKLVAGCASMAAVAAIGWSALVSFDSLDMTGKTSQMAALPVPTVSPEPALKVQIAGASLSLSLGSPLGSPMGIAQPGAVTGATAQGVMIRDPNLDALLAAHRQFGGSSALQMPTGFLRNATFEGAVRQ